MKRYLLSLSCVLTLSLLASKAYAEDNDTTATYLQEFVVESKNAWIEDDHAVFVPTRREKNRANSPQTLIQQMNIPYIQVDAEGALKDLRGENVNIYINGVEAKDLDLSTFWAKDVSRVEYYANPSNPAFNGEPAVVNFVVPVYQTGGVTKIHTAHRLPDFYGYYNAASKLVHKRMTFGLNFTGQVNNSKSSPVENTSYRDIWYDGLKYESIDNSRESHTKSRSANINAAFSAIYDYKNIRLEHTAGLSWNNNPVNETNGTNTWTPDLFSSEKSWSKSTSKSLTPWVRGYYIFKLHPKFRLTTSWEYLYASADGESYNQTGNADVIYNSQKENSHKFNINAYATYTFSRKFDLTLRLLNNTYFYTIHYGGSYNSISRQTYGDNQLQLVANWKPSNRISLSFTPTMNITHRTIKDVSSKCEVNPNFYFAFNWYQSDKAFMNVWSQYYTWQPYASSVNDVMQQESALMWEMGNPALKNCQIFLVGAGQSWMCTPWFTPSLNVQYGHGNHSVYRNYIAAPQDKGGVILQYADCGPENTLSCNLSLNMNLFNRKLSFNIQPGWKMVNTPGLPQTFTSHRFVFSGNVRYNISNFSIVAAYSASTKSYYNHGQYYDYSPDQLRFGLEYGNGNFYASFYANNILHKYYKGVYDFAFDNYVSRQELNLLGRNFYLNLAYTFGYGKKINPDIDINNNANFQSGALGF